LYAVAHKIHSFYYFFDSFERKEGKKCLPFSQNIDSGIETLKDEIPGFSCFLKITDSGVKTPHDKIPGFSYDKKNSATNPKTQPFAINDCNF